MSIRMILPICFVICTIGCSFSYEDDLSWRFETKRASMQWAVCDGNRLYLCADNVYCLDIATGSLFWQFHTFGTHFSEPVLDGGLLFFQSGGLYALDAETGAMSWEYWSNDWATMSPAVDGGRVYAPAGDRLHCIEAASGRHLWSINTGGIAGEPVAMAGRAFFCRDGEIFCVDGLNGKLLWQYGGGCEQLYPAGGGGMLISVASDGVVRAHRIETGEVRWQFETEVPLAGISQVSSGFVILGAKKLYCLDVNSGEKQWCFSRKDISARDAKVLGGFVIARAFPRGFFCLKLRDGAFVQRLSMPPGGRVLTDGNKAVFFSGGTTLAVSCIALPDL